MATPTGRTTECTGATREGRMSKAKQFIEAAETVEALANDAGDVADAYVTLCVHAGIAAADVICCKRLGEHSRGDDHTAAVALVGRASGTAAKNLRDLLGMKTKAGYSAAPVSRTDYKRAGRAARALVDEAMSF
jgi:hypothetical protein